MQNWSGTFGNDRSFRIIPAERTEFFGQAYWIDCYDEQGKHIRQEPSSHQWIPGDVEAKVLTDNGEMVRLNLPDGENCTVPRILVLACNTLTLETAEDVLVES